MGITTVGCDHCGLLLTNPQPTPEALSSFYRNDYRNIYQNTLSPSQGYIETLQKDQRANHLVRYLSDQKLLSEGISVLDVGCAEGAVLKSLKLLQPEIELEGIEPNPEFSHFAETYTGAKIYSDLTQLNNVSYDLIITNHVLEHISEPVGYIETLAGLLSDNGALYIGVPDAEAYQSLADIHIAHLYHFTRQTLTHLLAKAGLKLVHIEHHSPPRHPASIRCIAKKGRAAPQTPSTGRKPGWQQVRTIRRTSWLYFLRRSSPVRRLIKLVQKLTGTGKEPQP